MPQLTNPRHEAFAQARFRGMTAQAAHAAAGYTGGRANACRLARHPDIRARIAELNAAVAQQVVYAKADAIRDLLTIITASPEQANENHRLAIKRMAREKAYYVFPDKLRAIDRLARLMGWDKPDESPPGIDDSLTSVLDFVRRHK